MKIFNRLISIFKFIIGSSRSNDEDYEKHEEHKLYRKLKFFYLKSIEKDHEEYEIEEQMLFADDFLKQKAKVLMYKFENGD